MIPKIIHYCWFGGKEKTILAKKCIESWKRYCPDYEFIEWNEENFDLSYCPYVKEAYEEKKWAFITDVVRLYALVNYGGIYMDTDVEVLKPLDDLLELSAFSGFQTVDSIPTGIIAAEKEHALFRELLDDYKDIHFRLSDGSVNMETNVVKITNTCLKYGLILNNQKQEINGFTLYPVEYFCAKDILTGKLIDNSNTYAIHHFAGSWTTKKNRINTKIDRTFRKLFGNDAANSVRKIMRKN